MKWIPTSERLPENEEGVIITFLDNHGKPDTDFDYYDCYRHRWEEHSYVKAWMPLPEPWMGEEDEDSD